MFIVDDVAFIHPEHGIAIARKVERRKIRKHYYLETRADVLCRNAEVFDYWHSLGLRLMFIGLEAIDDEGLKLHRKRSSAHSNNKALEIARNIGLTVAINLIADPDWDERRFETVREWASGIEEVGGLDSNLRCREGFYGREFGPSLARYPARQKASMLERICSPLDSALRRLSPVRFVRQG